VWKGETDELGVGVTEDLYVTVPSGQQDSISADMRMNAMITAPVAKGDVYGKIQITLGEEILLERPIVALHAVPEGSLGKRMIDAIRLYFH
jgi:D-alanyl-D-alanine carboxypeptidase (penicillin-binding protein 5/6)